MSGVKTMVRNVFVGLDALSGNISNSALIPRRARMSHLDLDLALRAGAAAIEIANAHVL